MVMLVSERPWQQPETLKFQSVKIACERAGISTVWGSVRLAAVKDDSLPRVAPFLDEIMK